MAFDVSERILDFQKEKKNSLYPQNKLYKNTLVYIKKSLTTSKLQLNILCAYYFQTFADFMGRYFVTYQIV